MYDIGKRIRLLRLQNNMTQEELGRKIGVKYNTIASYERGDNLPSIHKLIAIADLFDVSLDELVGRSYNTYEEKLEKRRLIDEELEKLKKKLYKLFGVD